MRLAFGLTLIVLLATAQLAVADYECKGKMIELVWVKRVKAKIPADQKADFENGVPAQYVQSEESFNPHVFTGNYKELTYSAQGSSSGDSKDMLYDVLYRKALETPFSFKLLESCYVAPNMPSDPSSCWLPLDMGNGRPARPLAMLTPESQDRFSKSPVMMVGSLNAQRKDGKTVVGVGLSKMANMAESEVEAGEAEASFTFQKDPGEFEITASSERSHHSPLAVSIEVTCSKK